MGYEERLGNIEGFEEGINVLRSTKYTNLSYEEVVESLNKRSEEKQNEMDEGFWLCYLKFSMTRPPVVHPVYYSAKNKNYYYSKTDINTVVKANDIKRIKKLDISEYEKER